MSEPPQNPQPPDGGWKAPDSRPAAEDAPAPETPADETPPPPDRPPPYQGTYGAQPGPAASPAAPPAAGYGQPAYGQPGYGQPLPQAPPLPGYGAPGGPQNELAGRLARLGAGILDSIILGIVAVPAALVAIRWDKLTESAESGEPITDPTELYNIPVLLGGYLVVFILGFGYFTVGHARWGQTIGKKAFSIRVVKAADLSAVTWGQSIVREAVVYAISIVTVVLNFLTPAAGILGLVGLIDNAWILWDERRQALHDKAAGTVVMKATPWTPNPYARTAPPGQADGPGTV
ncbi:RDD family protein [Actinomadura monticuli]|uniref:RDD family protein n=1 Tax=Actinomadura monticuli TaxID=3097367 RepID=A0ABV4QEV6_9ACTN